MSKPNEYRLETINLKNYIEMIWFQSNTTVHIPLVNVTGFAKTVPIHTRTEIQFNE